MENWVTKITEQLPGRKLRERETQSDQTRQVSVGRFLFRRIK